MPQLLNENEVSYYLGEKHIYPKVEGGGAGDFIYDLDVSSLTSPGTLQIQDANFYPAIDAAYRAGKNVHVRLTYQTYFSLNGAILNLYIAQEVNGVIAYMFNATAYNNTLFQGVSGLMMVATGSNNILFWETASIGGTPIVNHTASETTVSIEPNVFHIWPQMSSLNITLATPEDLTIVNQYTFEFTSGSTATTLSLPSGILWPKGNPLTSPEANMIYEINIRNNKATWSSWEVTS